MRQSAQQANAAKTHNDLFIASGLLAMAGIVQPSCIMSTPTRAFLAFLGAGLVFLVFGLLKVTPSTRKHAFKVCTSQRALKCGLVAWEVREQWGVV